MIPMLWLAALVACDRRPEVVRPHVARLTHLQWEASVRDLFGVQGVGGASSFIGDPLTSGGFDNQADTLSVTPELWLDYQRGAEAVARRVVADRELYASLVPEDPTRDVVDQLPVVLQPEDGDLIPDNGDDTAVGWNLFDTGEMWAEVTLPGGPFVLEARVYGRQAGAAQVLAALRVDGETVFEGNVLARSVDEMEVISGAFQASGEPQRISVAFLKGYHDGNAHRNLIVESVTVRPGTGEDLSRGRLRSLGARWIERFGERVHRRPLTSDQQEAYVALFEQGTELPYTGIPFRDGVYTVLTAMLQSPHFLYRTEWVDPEGRPDSLGRHAIDPWSMASKLSYGLWNTMPDEELFGAAADGTLGTAEGVRAQARRMLRDPRARVAVDRFHEQLLNLDTYAQMHKHPREFPVWSPSMPDAMRREALDWTRDAVLGGATVRDFYTSPHTIIGGELAPLYGLELTDGASGRVELDPERRAGILTLVGFLAANAHAVEIDSIHRGVFVNRRLLCTQLPDPPDDVPPLPPAEPGLQNRERVDAHTGDGTCGQGCHSTFINPVGFAFENYDALGRWRDEEVGRPIRADGTFTFVDGPRSWTDPVGFALELAESADAHRCLVANWLRYTHGRDLTDDDRAFVDELAERSRSEDLAIDELIVELAASDGFRHAAREP